MGGWETAQPTEKTAPYRAVLTDGGIFVLDILTDTLLDIGKMLPFLFIACLVVELTEQRQSDRFIRALTHSGPVGPLFGALLGVIPQCGFSAMAANLYAGRIISLGTLLAVFLSTSDEAFFVLLTTSQGRSALIQVIGLRLVLAVLLGLLFNRTTSLEHPSQLDCSPEEEAESGIPWKAALAHTSNLTLYLLLFAFCINLVMAYFGENMIAQLLGSAGLFQPVIAAVIGMIPNCAASVLIGELYLSGALSFASLAAGLSSVTGLGLVVLFRSNPNRKQNIVITLILFASASGLGIVLQALSAL